LTLFMGDYGFQNLNVLARERNQNSSLQITNNVDLFNGTVHVTLTVKNHFVNFIDRPVGFHNPTQMRLQVDTVLAF
jgi:hypothetical protein